MKRVLLVIVGIIIFICSSKIVYADGINNYYIDATILNNGNLEVQEYFELDGYYNGMERILKYKNLSSIEFNKDDTLYGGSTIHNGNDIKIEEIRAVNVNSNFNFNDFDGDVFKKVEYASVGNYGVYTLKEIEGGVSTRIFLPSKKKKAFYIKYILNDMAVLHDDVGELGWSIFNTSLNESINNLIVYINIPNNKDIVKVWAHGPENGKSNIISNEKVEATIDNLSSNTAIDIRVVFDKDVINNSTKTTNTVALDKIINYETELANISNKKREDNIENSFRILDTNPTMVNYNYVLYSINEYNNDEKTDFYLNRLYKYKYKVDESEYNHFKYLTFVIGNYDSYVNTKYSADNVFNIELKNKIIEERKQLKNKLIKQELVGEFKSILIAISTVVLVYLIVSMPRLISKKIKKVDPIYVRDLPNDISVISAGILIDKKISKDEISAAILDLVRKKIVILDNSDKKNPILIINKDNYQTATDKDRYLVNMIFEHNNSISLKKNKKISRERFKCWKNLFIRELKDKGYIIETKEPTMNINIGAMIFSIISFMTPLYFFGIFFLLVYSIQRYKQYTILVIFQIINYVLLRNVLLNNHFIYFSLIINIMSIVIIFLYLRKIVFNLNVKLTNLGLEKKNELYALRNYLNDFSRLYEKDIPEVSLWEEYLVYATVFGIGDKVLNSMKLKNMNNNLLENVSFINNYNDYVGFFSNVSNNITYVSVPEMNFVMPESSGGSSSDWGSSSSGSGSGGGFSGGSSSGGSFGGGGGGGRF